MMFLKLNDVVVAVNQRYRNYPAPGFTFESSDMSMSDVDLIQTRLGVTIDGEFRELLMRFTIGNLTLGFVTFGSGMSNAEYLLEANPPDSWWLLSDSDLIRIAETDGFSVFVNGRQGTVYAVEAGSRSLALVSDSIVRFIEVLGTLCSGSVDPLSKSLVAAICDYCGCDRSIRFWRR